MIPLEKYIDEGYAPNLKKIFDEHPDIRKSFTTPDGHMYALPNIDLSAVWYRGPMWYNGKFLKALEGDGAAEDDGRAVHVPEARQRTRIRTATASRTKFRLTSVKLDDLRMFFLGFWGIYDEADLFGQGRQSALYASGRRL